MTDGCVGRAQGTLDGVQRSTEVDKSYAYPVDHRGRYVVPTLLYQRGKVDRLRSVHHTALNLRRREKPSIQLAMSQIVQKIWTSDLHLIKIAKNGHKYEKKIKVKNLKTSVKKN